MVHQDVHAAFNDDAVRRTNRSRSGANDEIGAVADMQGCSVERVRRRLAGRIGGVIAIYGDVLQRGSRRKGDAPVRIAEPYGKGGVRPAHDGGGEGLHEMRGVSQRQGSVVPQREGIARAEGDGRSDRCGLPFGNEEARIIAEREGSPRNGGVPKRKRRLAAEGKGFRLKGIPGSHVQGVVRPVLERYGTGDNVAGQCNGFNPFRSRENNRVIIQEGSIRLASISTLVPARSSVAPGTGSGIPDKRFRIVACSLILHGHAGTVGDKHEIAGSQLVGGIDSRQCLIGVLPGLLPNKKGIQGSPQISPGGHEITGQQGIVHQLAVGNRQRFHGARNYYLYIPRPVILGHCSGI